MKHHQKAIIFLLICSIAAFFVNREDERNAIDPLNSLYEDWLRGTSREQLTPPSITLLRIDDSDKGFWSWPPNPLDYAQMLHRIKSYNPKVVAAEPLLHWQNADTGLLEALRTACLQYNKGQILLSSILQFNQASRTPEEATLSLLWPLPSIDGDIKKIPVFTNVISLPNQRLTSLGFPAGFTTIDLAEDTRPEAHLSVPLLARINNTVVPSFVLLATMLELDVTADEIEVELGTMIHVGNEITIPIDDSGSLEIFTGMRAGPAIHNASILAHEPVENPATTGGGLSREERVALENRVILLGLDNKASRTIPTKGGENISQAELFALAIATIQSRSYFGPVAERACWIFWVAILIAGVMILRQRRRRAISFSLLLIFLYFTASMVFFQATQRWVPPAVPLTLLACILLSTLLLTSPGKDSKQADNTDDTEEEKNAQ